MNRLSKELAVFRSHPHNMRVLILTNLIYALVMPVIEIFIGAYVMRNSGDVKMVVVYQLAVYTGIPATFVLNDWLLQKFGIARLYSLGMLMSGVSLTVMMSLGELTIASSWMIHRSDFRNPPKTRFIYFRSHPLWLRMQGLAVLKGLALILIHKFRQGRRCHGGG